MKTIIYDGNCLAHVSRFRNALRHNGVLYGIIDMLYNISNGFYSNQIIFVWDSRKSFRKLLDPDYKKGRALKKKTKEERHQIKQMYKEIAILQEYLPHFGITSLMCEGYEGDDLIHSVIHRNPTQNFIIVANDHDLYSLLDHNVSIYDFKTMISKKIFEEKYGISPEQWDMVKMIAGCVSDEITGVPGVGEKTAIKYLKGELSPSTKAYQSIKDNRYLIWRNRHLVEQYYVDIPQINEFREIKYKKIKRFSKIYDLPELREYSWKDWSKGLFRQEILF